MLFASFFHKGVFYFINRDGCNTVFKTRYSSYGTEEGIDTDISHSHFHRNILPVFSSFKERR